MSYKEMQENIDCYECGAHFTIKYSFEQDRVVYCPFCGTDLPLEEDEDDDDIEDDYNDHDDYDEREY